MQDIYSDQHFDFMFIGSGAATRNLSFISNYSGRHSINNVNRVCRVDFHSSHVYTSAFFSDFLATNEDSGITIGARIARI